MTLEKLVGTDYDCREEPDRFYRTAVERLGGPAALREAIPFSLKTLKESYAEDKNFNADMTPLGMWDAATGNGGKFGRIVYTKITGAPFRGILRNHGISYVTPSQAVCILKTAAQMLVERQIAD